MSVYETREEDVVKMIRILGFYKPELATEEKAREVLANMSQSLHQKIQDTALLNADNLDTIVSAVIETLERK